MSLDAEIIDPRLTRWWELEGREQLELIL